MNSLFTPAVRIHIFLFFYYGIFFTPIQWIQSVERGWEAPGWTDDQCVRAGFYTKFEEEEKEEEEDEEKKREEEEEKYYSKIL